LKKYSQGGNREIDYDSEYLGKHIGIPKSTMLRMLEDLNGAMLVKSEKKNNGKGGRKFIHRVLWEYGRWDIFKENRFSRGKIGTGTGS
jgi:predicted transcriptional regulator